MATYTELRGVFGDDAYQKLIEAAVVDAAYLVIAEASPTAPRLKLAYRIIEDPLRYATLFARAILFKNKAGALAAIKGASDAAALTEVQSIYTKFATEYGV